MRTSLMLRRAEVQYFLLEEQVSEPHKTQLVIYLEPGTNLCQLSRQFYRVGIVILFLQTRYTISQGSSTTC